MVLLIILLLLASLILHTGDPMAVRIRSEGVQFFFVVASTARVRKDYFHKFIYHSSRFIA